MPECQFDSKCKHAVGPHKQMLTHLGTCGSSCWSLYRCDLSFICIKPHFFHSTPATSFNLTKGEEGNDTLTKLDIEAKCFIPVIGPTVNESQGWRGNVWNLYFSVFISCKNVHSCNLILPRIRWAGWLWVLPVLSLVNNLNAWSANIVTCLSRLYPWHWFGKAQQLQACKSRSEEMRSRDVSCAFAWNQTRQTE